jgi:pimeloyl-ACP methyl ester carboxylesterase
VRVGEQRVAYRSVGHGRPLVLVMGLSGTMDAWPPSFVDALSRDNHRVVLLDNAGVGRSTLRGTLSIRGMADTTAGLIRKLRLRRPDIAGWSMGGMITQSLLVRHPKLVRRAVLMATTPGDGFLAPPQPDALASLAGGGVVSLLFGSGAPDTAPADYVADIAQRRGFAPTTTAEVRAQQIAASGEWLGGRDPDGARIGRLRLPVLIGGGREDPVLPIGNQIHIARTIKRAQYVEYPTAAHGFFIQEAEDFVPLMLDFLGG